MKSKLFRLNKNDFIKGLIVALFSTIAPALLLPDMTIKNLLIVVTSTLLTYLAKNIITNSNDEILKTEKNGF